MAKKDTPILSLRHAFKYTFAEPVTVAELVDSLKGYEKLVVTFLPRILNAVLETEVCGIIVRVEEVEQGSLIEKFIFDLLFKDEQSYRQFIDAVRKFSGVDDAHEGNYMRLISVFIAVLLVAGQVICLGISTRNRLYNKILLLSSMQMAEILACPVKI